jgi:Tfp pilus assembly pilus retraction ATPase PilT
MNNENYHVFFGMTKEPYRSDLTPDEILETEGLVAVKNRFDYALRLGGVVVITGEIGSGKSTSL